MGFLDILDDDQNQGGNSKKRGQQKSQGNKGGRSSSKRGLASAPKATRERVARMGGKSSRR